MLGPASTQAAATASRATVCLVLAGLEAYEGTTIVRGIMRKAACDEVLHPAAWQALKETYPDFFDVEVVAPRWED